MKIKFKCPHCESDFYVEGDERDRVWGCTFDCPSCKSLLVADENTESAKDFHKWLHADLPIWPAHGIGTGHVEIDPLGKITLTEDGITKPAELIPIITRLKKRMPLGTKIEIQPSELENHVDVRVLLPGNKEFNQFKNLKVENNVVDIPLKLIFLCHAKEDKGFVNELNNKLISDGFITWLDTQDLLPGDEWKQKIEEAMEQSDYVIVVLSKRSLSKSGFVNKEIRYAISQWEYKPLGKKYIIPIMIDECDLPRGLKELQWLNIEGDNWCQSLLEALVLG